jgi:hypothetical protein
MTRKSVAVAMLPGRLITPVSIAISIITKDPSTPQRVFRRPALSESNRKPFRLIDIPEFVGQSLGVSDWVDIDQVQVNIFGEVTRWAKPGHCNPEYGKTTPLWGNLDSWLSYGGTMLIFF